MKIISILPAEKTCQLNSYIKENLLPLATAEKAKCALGRKQLWLEAEPVYYNKTYKSGIHDERLWTYLKKLWFDVDLAQVYFGNTGIDWHRDATYAEANARILNLGCITLETKTRSEELISLTLTGGEIIEFNSKLLHRAINPHPDRIGIGMWKAKIPIKF